MPRELTALMIKTSGNPDALRPSMVRIPLSVTTSGTDEILAAVREAHPHAFTEGTLPGDQGAILVPAQAHAITSGWRDRMNRREQVFSSGFVADEIDELVMLAKQGHTMILQVH